jgi:hypothetical protein
MVYLIYWCDCRALPRRLNYTSYVTVYARNLITSCVVFQYHITSLPRDVRHASRDCTSKEPSCKRYGLLCELITASWHGIHTSRDCTCRKPSNKLYCLMMRLYSPARIRKASSRAHKVERTTTWWRRLRQPRWAAASRNWPRHQLIFQTIREHSSYANWIKFRAMFTKFG